MLLIVASIISLNFILIWIYHKIIKLLGSWVTFFCFWIVRLFFTKFLEFFRRIFIRQFLARTKKSFSAFTVPKVLIENFKTTVDFIDVLLTHWANTSMEWHYDWRDHVCIRSREDLFRGIIFICRHNWGLRLNEGILFGSSSNWVWWEDVRVYESWICIFIIRFGRFLVFLIWFKNTLIIVYKVIKDFILFFA